MILTVGTNSYISLADALAYFDESLNYETWYAASERTKTRALMTASKKLNLSLKEEYQLPITLPVDSMLGNAVAELALAMIIDPDVISQSSTGSNTKSVKAGPVDVKFFKRVKGTKFPTVVMSMLRIGGYLPSAVAGGASAFGTGCVSSFENVENYGLDTGFF